MESVLNLDDTPPSRLDMARALLQPKPRRDAAWPALAAAALFALSGLAFAFAAITAQPAEYRAGAGFEPVPEAASER